MARPRIPDSQKRETIHLSLPPGLKRKASALAIKTHGSLSAMILEFLWREIFREAKTLSKKLKEIIHQNHGFLSGKGIKKKIFDLADSIGEIIDDPYAHEKIHEIKSGVRGDGQLAMRAADSLALRIGAIASDARLNAHYLAPAAETPSAKGKADKGNASAKIEKVTVVGTMPQKKKT